MECQRNTRIYLVLLKTLDRLMNQTARKTNVVLLICPALEAVCIEQFTTSSPVLLRIFPIVQIGIFEYFGVRCSDLYNPHLAIFSHKFGFGAPVSARAPILANTR